MWKSTKEKAITLLVVTSVLCYQFCYGREVNLTESCSKSQLHSCVLFDISTSYAEPFLIVNSTQSVLDELIIRDTILVRFPYEIFERATNLHTFIMHNCGLNRIRPSDFENALHLRNLVLQRNRLSEITEKVFAAVPSLKELRLGQNHIHMVHRLAFAGLTQLSHLDLQQNAIYQLSESSFSPLVNLEYLDLSGNEIAKIDSSTFAANTKLTTLLLNNNKFVVFEPNSLEHLPHLHLLDVSNCVLEELNLQSVDTVYAQNSSLKRFNIRGNIIKFHASNNELRELKISDKASVRELELHGNLFESLVDFIGMDNLQHLDLSKNHISTLTYGTSSSSHLLSLPSLNYLNLAFNKLENLTMENFLLLSRLNHLDIAFNRIVSLDANVFMPLRKLEKLYIDGNGLKIFNYQKFFEAHPLIKEMGLSLNSWDTNHIREMESFLEKNSVQLVHHYPITVPKIFSTPTSTAGYQPAYKTSLISTDLSNCQEEDICQCSSPNVNILIFVTFILVLLSFSLQVSRLLREKNCCSFFWRRSTLRFRQQFQTEPLDESVSEV